MRTGSRAANHQVIVWDPNDPRAELRRGDIEKDANFVALNRASMDRVFNMPYTHGLLHSVAQDFRSQFEAFKAKPSADLRFEDFVYRATWIAPPVGNGFYLAFGQQDKVLNSPQ